MVKWFMRETTGLVRLLSDRIELDRFLDGGGGDVILAFVSE